MSRSCRVLASLVQPVLSILAARRARRAVTPPALERRRDESPSAITTLAYGTPADAARAENADGGE
jgi:hypothetical protein